MSDIAVSHVECIKTTYERMELYKKQSLKKRKHVLYLNWLK